MSDLTKGMRKDNSKRKGMIAAKKKRKKEEAEKRQATYNTLTLEQKLNNPRLGIKEKAKLLNKSLMKGN